MGDAGHLREPLGRIADTSRTDDRLHQFVEEDGSRRLLERTELGESPGGRWTPVLKLSIRLLSGRVQEIARHHRTQQRRSPRQISARCPRFKLPATAVNL